MGFINWLRGAGQKVLGGLNWLGQNIGKPILSVARNIPIVGDVVRAAEPALNAVSKTSQWAQDALGGVSADKRRKLPSADEVKAGFQSIGNTGRAITSGMAKVGAML